MTKEVVFSIIIPVYNMEQYLARCLYSIVNQTYKKLDIVIINDGSTDKSMEIINFYARADSRITVIDKNNEGIGSAYIDALNVVKGDYISFVDSDDYVELNMYEKLNHHISEKSPDIIQFGYKKIDQHDCVIEKVNFGEAYIIGNMNVENFRYEKISHPSIGLKVMKKELFNDIALLRQNVGIDVLVSLQIYIKAESLLIIKNEFYNILVRMDSVSRVRYDENKVNQLKNLRELIFKITMATKNKDLISRVLPTFLNETVIICRYYYKNNNVQYNKLIKEYRTYYVLLFDVVKLSKLSVFAKATFFYFFPKTYLKVS